MLTLHGNRLDGCIFGDGSPMDTRMEFGDNTPPRKVDLRQHCTAVEDQGQIGSCTANACVGALEYAYTKRDGRSPDLSRLFVYYNTRRLRGNIQQDTGAQINEAMAAVMAFGACEAGHWPYDPGRMVEEPPQQAYTNGKQHEAIQYARVPGPHGAINALASGYPVVYGTFLPSRCYEEAARTGRVPKTTPEERSGKPGGGHCMLIVGYDLDQQIFTVRNSWGTGWGAQGYVDIPFEEMVYWSPPETFWIMLELEPAGGGFSIIRPAVSQAAPAAASSSVLGATASDLRSSIGGGLRADMDRSRQDIANRMGRMRASLDRSDTAARGAGTLGETAGAVACNPCGGQGKCYNCKGSGTIMGAMCMACRGGGSCHVCSGKGTVEQAAAKAMLGPLGDSLCNTCNGSGSCYNCMSVNYHPDMNCVKCYGRGVCNSCGGQGFT